MLDFALETEAAERIAAFARTDVDRVQSLLFPVLTQTEAALTAQVPLHTCPNCSRQGLALKHWRRAWAVDCQVCGALLTPILGKPGIGLLSDHLLRRARVGAVLLGSAVTRKSVSQIRRGMRGVAFAMALRNARGAPAAALQSYNPEVRLFCLAAIAAVQKRPLLEAALFTTGIDDFAKVALLRTYHKEADCSPPSIVSRAGCSTEFTLRNQGVANKPDRHLTFKSKEYRLSTPNATNLRVKGKATVSLKHFRMGSRRQVGSCTMVAPLRKSGAASCLDTPPSAPGSSGDA